jgi:hypothetical protein
MLNEQSGQLLAVFGVGSFVRRREQLSGVAPDRGTVTLQAEPYQFEDVCFEFLHGERDTLWLLRSQSASFHIG